ncbi:hypothetical protein LSTR_LSTR003832 [Laodelphax striatellus]|uniref:DUF4781 domain-containing protein n=1 Tax=Laodelphax striatellus TaxID=195883 RepID=A0A482XER5_LAOST|nr:hypothetical protein LSTR_LSTR003832 [Laodelphax striatellus]
MDLDGCFTPFLFRINKFVRKKNRNLQKLTPFHDDQITEDTMNLLDISIPPDQDWKKRARKYQQNQYNSLGDRYWDIVPDDLLHRKIGFALYGIPTEIEDSNLNYSEEKNKHIDKLKNYIISVREDNSSNVTHLASIFIYVHSKEGDNVAVVFRFLKNANENLDDFLFVDSNCRTYKCWNDYLKNNELPRCTMCYPVNGFYTASNGFVDVGFCKSPASEISRNILTGLDITSSMLGLGATGVSLASFAIPIAAPFVWGATATIIASGAYDLGRGVNRLVDIGVHKESLSLKNPKSRKVWLDVLTSTVGIASVGVTKGLSVMRAGQVVSKGEAVAMRIINISSLAFSGISGVNSLITVVVKFLDGTLEMSDILQFSSACYFFLNALLSLDLANRMIEEIASSDDISNLFFSTNNSDFSVVKSITQFFDSNSYEILRRLVLGSIINFMPNINLSDLEMIAKRISGLIDAHSSGMQWKKFAVEMIAISEFIWKSFGKEILHAIDKLRELFDAEDWKSVFTTSAQNHFLDSNLDVARQLCLAAQKAMKHCTGRDTDDAAMKKILTLASVFNSKYPADCSIEFLNMTKFVCDCVAEEFDEIMSKYFYLRDEEQAKSSDFDNEAFNKNYGIEENGDLRSHFIEIAIKRLSTEERMKKMMDDYTQLSKMCDHPKNELPSMETSMSYHYMYSEPLGQFKFSDGHYWKKMNEITGLDFTTENATMLKEKGIILIRPKIENNSIKAIIFYSTKVNGCMMGIITVIKSSSQTIVE